MNVKQIKNYLIIAVLIFSGLITLYNTFFGEAEDNSSEQLAAVEQSGSELTDADETSDTNVQSDSSQIELAVVEEVSTEGNSDTNTASTDEEESVAENIDTADSDGLTEETQADETNVTSTEQEETETNKEEETYNQALKSINGYYDVTSVQWLEDQDDYVIESYLKYAADGWYGLVDGQSYGTKAGGRWGNYDDQLPEYDDNNNEITYKEFDVNDKIDGRSRDAERFVVGSDGSVYYTYDHYDSFIKVIE